MVHGWPLFRIEGVAEALHYVPALPCARGFGGER